MYSYTWDEETGGLLLNTTPLAFSKEPRPVYYKELDLLGFDKHWHYAKDDSYPYMWAEANNYYYRGRLVAKTKGGSLYTAPELILMEEPEPDGGMLRFVDVPRMVQKNKEIMDSLVQETIKKIYNTYVEHKNRIDVFYVAFSGGKDSVVTLDLVKSALPNTAFKVLFGDTGMEFPTTYELIQNIKNLCEEQKIDFYETKSNFSSEQSWNLFGPPARQIRWCCTVHKSAPVINKIRKILGKDKIKVMMITGVRGDESSARNLYNELSIGKKIAGQYSFHPILQWGSHEVFLYIYGEQLFNNEAYKFGFSRVGCIMCPNSTGRHEYFKRKCFKQLVDKFCGYIVATSNKHPDELKSFLEEGGWKVRYSGRELKFKEDEKFWYDEKEKKFYALDLNSDWKTWYKTIGNITNCGLSYKLDYNNEWYDCKIERNGNTEIILINKLDNSKKALEFIHLFKAVLAKSQYCVQCGACLAICPNGCIEMRNGMVSISDKCVHCHECLKILSGCLYFNSVKGSKKMKKIAGVNRYLSVGVDNKWIMEFSKDNTFQPGNRKTDVMYLFLRDAGVVEKKYLTETGKIILSMDLEYNEPWALMACNLAYSSVIGWIVKNIAFNEKYFEKRLDEDMGDEVTKKAKGEFWNSVKTILYTSPSFQQIGLGIPDVSVKINRNGEEKRSMESLTRNPWLDPDPRVILYSLYKFAEACDGYYQFTVTYLMDTSIERNGISPSEIFGITKDNLIKILNGLSVNYPEFISVRFTYDLDTIVLNSDKKAIDVLQLF